MITSHGSGSYAQAASYWNLQWAFGPKEYLNTGQTYSTNLITQDNTKSEILVWDGASPMINPTNYVVPMVYSMSPYPACSGPQIPSP